MSKSKFSIKQRFRSFPHAINGLRLLVKEEHNARIHLLAAIIALLFSWSLNINLTEWCLVIFSIAFVFTMELVNSSIENVCDRVSPEFDEHIKKAKDLAAAAVLISAGMALVIGLIIFLPKIWFLFSTYVE